MKTRSDWIFVAGAVVAACAITVTSRAAEAAVTYEVIDIPAPHGAVHPPMGVYDVSDDGSVVVGFHYTGTDVDPYSYERALFLWKDGILVYLENLLGFEPVEGYRALCISGDGSVIAGYMGTSPVAAEAFTYNLKDEQLTRLGFLPGATWSRASDISADGSVVVGESGNLAFRWENGVMTNLGDLPGGEVDSSARAVSADGSVVVGSSSSASGSEAFRWENGIMMGLGDLPGGQFYSMATAASGDGSVIVGYGVPESGTWKPFRWKDGVMTNLERDLDVPSGALGVSSDGSVVSGFLGGGWHGGSALYWDGKNAWQPVFLNDLLDDAGVSRAGFGLMNPLVTPDGSTFVGFGIADRALQIYRIRISDLPLDPLIGGIPIAGQEDWCQSDWFGVYCTTYAPWLFHAEHGFLYRDPESTNESLFVYYEAMGTWCWTNEAMYPFIYAYDPPADIAGTDIDSAWLFYFRDSDDGRVFSVLDGPNAGSFLFYGP